MRVYVITFCEWNSFGSMLQSLGLKRALASLGFESVILSISPQRSYRMRLPKTTRDAYYFPTRLLHHQAFKAACQKAKAFLADHIDMIFFKDSEEARRSYPLDGVYLAGSDQIWNPTIRNLEFYYMDFVRGIKKLTYAVSMGKEQIPEERKPLLRKYLSDFAYLSVREEAAKTALSQLTDAEIRVNIDPSFLLSQDEWRSYETPYPIHGKYILVYTIYWDKDAQKRLKTLRRKTGLPVVAIKPAPSVTYATRPLYDVGPGEFLWLIDHAAYVVTSSFHGAAFSVIFNKPFAAVINPSSPSRLTQLLRTSDLPQVEIDDLCDEADFDYSGVNQRIECFKQDAYRYLRSALS